MIPDHTGEPVILMKGGMRVREVTMEVTEAMCLADTGRDCAPRNVGDF